MKRKDKVRNIEAPSFHAPETISSEESSKTSSPKEGEKENTLSVDPAEEISSSSTLLLSDEFVKSSSHCKSHQELNPSSPSFSSLSSSSPNKQRPKEFKCLSPLEHASKVTMERYCGPTPESNWVIPGRLLVGAYPASENDEETFSLIASILKCGVKKFVCLQQEYRMQGVTESMYAIYNSCLSFFFLPSFLSFFLSFSLYSFLSVFFLSSFFLSSFPPLQLCLLLNLWVRLSFSFLALKIMALIFQVEVWPSTAAIL